MNFFDRKKGLILQLALDEKGIESALAPASLLAYCPDYWSFF